MAYNQDRKYWARTVACPLCAAKVGEPCVKVRDGSPRKQHHQSRYDSAEGKPLSIPSADMPRMQH